jgi:hypothetical protein
MQPRFFVVDALNICKETARGRARLSILLSLLLELRKKGHDFLCIFDESAYREFKTQGTNTLTFYNSLIRDYETHFSKIRGKADEKVVVIADKENCAIISNDNFKEYRQAYAWLNDSTRVVKVSLVRDTIFAEGVQLKANATTDIEAVWNDLKPYLQLRTSRANGLTTHPHNGHNVRTSPAKPKYEPSVVVSPREEPKQGRHPTQISEPRAIEETTSPKTMPTRGNDIIEQLVAGGFLTPDIAQILRHGVEEQATVVRTEKNEMVAVVLVIDKSASMQQWQDDIIDGQKIMIQGLLGAAPKFDIRFGQILFNHEVEYFQPISEFRDKSDPERTSPDVKILNKQVYKPNGFTALYDAILKGICSLAPIFYASQDIGFALQSKVCILTDGIDEGQYGAGSKIPPQELGKAIRYMLDEQLISEIILAGIGNFNYKDVGKEVGIDNVIQIPTNTSGGNLEEAKRQIRAAFKLFSETRRTK